MQTLLRFEEEVWDWVQVVWSCGKSAKNGKVKQDQAQYNWNDVNQVQKEGVLIIPTQSEGANPGLNLTLCLLCFKSGDRA